MRTDHAHPGAGASGLFVIRLEPASHGAALSGRLEHVMSGRQHDFDSAEALLECLQHEQRQARLQHPRPPEETCP